MEIIVGTAGHIDHGKTTLVKALTGVDADRLPEEKERGITIDIGFAQSLIEDVHFGFVDVPGHERFVKNMLAGVSGIDLVLLVIAADEGVMPQTREHFEICRLLGVSSGLVVLSKFDLVDEETLELARLEVAELVEGSFLENAAVVRISSKTGEGLKELSAALIAAARSVTRSADKHVTRLPVDRSFTVKGFGTVVTGTLVSGEMSAADELEILPTGLNVRVRGVQTHGEKVQRVGRGNRVAVNLAGIDRSEVERGMTLSEIGVLRPTQIIDAKVEVLRNSPRNLKSRQRVRVHIGTKEALARISVLNDPGFITPGSTDYVQIRLESPVIALPGERFIIRAYSPQTTVAGGGVIDNLAEKHRKKDFPSIRENLSIAETTDHARLIVNYLEQAAEKGLGFQELQARTGLKASTLRESLEANLQEQSIVDCGDYFIARTAFEKLAERSIVMITDFHRREPLSAGLPLDDLRETVFARLAPQIGRSVVAGVASTGIIVSENDKVRLATHTGELTDDEAAVTAALRSIYEKAGCEVPRFDDVLNEIGVASNLDRQQIRTVFQLLVNRGELVKVADEFYFSAVTVDLLVKKLRENVEKSGDATIDVAKFKELAGVSRKYAIPLLEYFDRAKVTVRSGDKRIILK